MCKSLAELASGLEREEHWALQGGAGLRATQVGKEGSVPKLSQLQDTKCYRRCPGRGVAGSEDPPSLHSPKSAIFRKPWASNRRLSSFRSL